MSVYSLVDQSDVLEAHRITPAMFGGNGLNVNHGLADPASVTVNNIDAMGVRTLRYPGGGVTEKWFDIHNPEADRGYFEGAQSKIVGMTDFLKSAKALDATVNFVLPTIDGFTVSAGEAIESGQYGNRVVSSEFIADIKDFVQHLYATANNIGVELASIEVGNEFWGSGRMTSTEYGKLAGHMTVAIEEALEEIGISSANQPQIVVQTISSAGFFSPNEDKIVYVETLVDNAGETIGYEFYNNDGPGREIQVIPGQGSASTQALDIVETFNTVQGAADAVDAVSDHIYAKKGFEGIDEDQTSGFRQLNKFIENLDRSEALPRVEKHITEWNAKADDGNRSYDHNKGLQGAALMVETFYELASNGTEAAQVWPLESKAGQTSLSIINEQREALPGLTIAGEMFNLLNESLVGTKASIDFSVTGEIDIHGFSKETDKDVLFISERSGHENSFELVLSEVQQAPEYFIVRTDLSDGHGDGQDAFASPIVISHDGYLSGATSLNFLDVEAYGNIRVEITYVTSGDDEITGRSGDDNIRGRAGNDTLTGYEGNDTLIGDGGFDQLFGGRGDDFLDGGHQADNLFGKHGDDVLIGDQGRDRLFGGDGEDQLYGGLDDDRLFGESGNDLIVGGSGNDTSYGGRGDDAIDGGNGSDILYGDLGSDTISGGAGNDMLNGSAGFDVLNGGDGDDVLTGGLNWDTFVFSGNFGNDVIQDFDVDNRFEKIDLSSISSIQDVDDLFSNHVRDAGEASEERSTIIEDGLGNSVLLVGVELELLAAGDFIL